MSGARSDATVTVLSNGRWLIVGGRGSGLLRDTEILDPVAQTSTPGPTLATGRAGHTATLLPNGKVAVFGGEMSTAGSSASLEIVDVAGNSVTMMGAAPQGRRSHTATLLNDGRLFFSGGFDERGYASTTTALYDPATDTWTQGPNMAFAREEHTATLLSDGTVAIAGGKWLFGRDTSLVSGVERFDPATNQLTAGGSLLTRRYGHTATAVAGGVLLVGGTGADGTVLDSVELVQPDQRRSELKASMGVARSGHRAVMSGANLVVVAGKSDGPDSDVTAQIYSPATNTWQLPVRLTSPRTGAVVAIAGSGVLACGGSGTFGQNPTASCEPIASTNGATLPAIPRVNRLRLEKRETTGTAYTAYRAGRPGPMVFDEARQTILTLSLPAQDGDPQATYTWDGAYLALAASSAASPAPSRRSFGLAYDRGRSRVVLFGGERRQNFNMDETWEWNGASWSKQTPALSPSPRVYPQMTYDATRGRVLLFGGRNNAGSLNDLWSWDGTTWTELTSTVRPPATFVSGSQFAFDEARGVAVLTVHDNISHTGSEKEKQSVSPREEEPAKVDVTPEVRISARAEPPTH